LGYYFNCYSNLNSKEAIFIIGFIKADHLAFSRPSNLAVRADLKYLLTGCLFSFLKTLFQEFS